MHYGSIMNTITLKDVPPAVHRALKARAKTHGRSLNKEIMATLECSLHSVKIDAATVASHARAIREEMGGYLTQAKLSELKDTGRR